MVAQKKSAERKPVSVFDTAKKVNAAGPATVDPDLVEIKDFQLVGAIKTVVESLEGLDKVVRGDVYENHAVPRWLKEILTTHAKPENFNAVDTKNRACKGNVQAKKRATNSPLTEEQVALLEEHGIPYDTSPIKQGVSKFLLNPVYDEDERLPQWGQQMADPHAIVMEVVRKYTNRADAARCEKELNEKLLKIPTDMFVQATKPTVSDQTISEICRRTDPDINDNKKIADPVVLRQLFDIVFTKAIKPVGGIKLKDALKIVVDKLNEGEQAEHDKLKEDLQSAAAA